MIKKSAREVIAKREKVETETAATLLVQEVEQNVSDRVLSHQAGPSIGVTLHQANTSTEAQLHTIGNRPREIIDPTQSLESWQTFLSAWQRFIVENIWISNKKLFLF